MKESENDGCAKDTRSKIISTLEFYADKANWVSPSSGFALQYDPEPSPVSKDRGKKARNILKEGFSL